MSILKSTHISKNIFLLLCVGMALQFLNYPLPIQMMSVNEEKLNIIKKKKGALHIICNYTKTISFYFNCSTSYI